MKILTVVGARPQFIKASAFSAAVRRDDTEILVHTGQHYDPSLSGVFFKELNIPEPDYHLDVGSGSHAYQTGQMLQRLEPVMMAERPDWVAVFGDTNTTLAGALAATKLGLRVAHVEAGLRSFDRRMPEEINRSIADHVSDLLFAPTEQAMKLLYQEGLSARAHLTGDIMFDVLLLHARRNDDGPILDQLGLRAGEYALATVHRASNTEDLESLGRILDGFAMLDGPVIFPIHPRARLALASSDLEVPGNARVIEPVGYLDMLTLQRNARVVLTDSGGIQKEALMLRVPCVTLRQETEWPETLEGGWNVLVGNDPEAIAHAARRTRPEGEPRNVFGDGHAAERMVRLLHDDPPDSGCVS